MKNIIRTLIIGGLIIYANNLFAQCDSIATVCKEHFTSSHISDGQQYRALLIDDEIAEFNITLFGGSTYRIAACSGLSDGNLIFSIFDSQHNLLFSNKDYSNASYWDFSVKSTIDCKIEAQLDNRKITSGCAVLLIGFKQ